MPNPMAQHTFQQHLASIKSAAEVAAKQSMDTAAMELRNAMDVHGDELTDCRAMFGGTWRNRGHSSLQGALTCISALTRKLLDYESLNKVCHKCARYSNRDSDDYQNFMPIISVKPITMVLLTRWNQLASNECIRDLYLVRSSDIQSMLVMVTHPPSTL